MIQISHPLIGLEEVDAVSSVIKSGKIASGEKVKEFENNFEEYCKVNDAIAVNNGTSALHASLVALGIGCGDEVILPNFTFVATASTVLMCGATPIFCDVDIETFNIIPENISDLITCKTKAVIGVHLYGQSCDTKSISEICEDSQLKFIEDAAQAHGALNKGYKVGGLGDIGCFSFYATKNMTTGEGGMITTNDKMLSDIVRRIINHGQSYKYRHSELGYNYRMTDIQAAMGIEQLKKLNDFNNSRRFNAKYYEKHLNNIKLTKPKIKNFDDHVFHQYVIKLNDDVDRIEFMNYLQVNKIGSAIHYPIPISKQPMMRFITYGDRCINSDFLSQHVLSLPVHPGVSLMNLKYICEIINNYTS